MNMVERNIPKTENETQWPEKALDLLAKLRPVIKPLQPIVLSPV